MSKPVFSTERLDVFRIEAERNEKLGLPRDVYLAFHRHEDIPRPIVACTIFCEFSRYVEWLETEERFRRKGYATEMLRGVENFVGQCDCTGVTESGEAFLDAYCAAQDGAK